MKFKIHKDENGNFILAEYGDGLVYINAINSKKKLDELGPAWLRYSKTIEEFEGEMEDFQRIIIKEQVKKSLLTNDNNSENLKSIKEELRKWEGNQYFIDYRGNLILLIGATSTDEDYYWITIDEDEKLMAHSCVGYPGKFVKKPKTIEKFEKMRQEGTLVEYINKRMEEYCNNNVDVRIEV